jgi:hypothetical protein
VLRVFLQFLNFVRFHLNLALSAEFGHSFHSGKSKKIAEG